MAMNGINDLLLYLMQQTHCDAIMMLYLPLYCRFQCLYSVKCLDSVKYMVVTLRLMDPENLWVWPYKMVWTASHKSPRVLWSSSQGNCWPLVAMSTMSNQWECTCLSWACALAEVLLLCCSWSTSIVPRWLGIVDVRVTGLIQLAVTLMKLKCEVCWSVLGVVINLWIMLLFLMKMTGLM